MGETSIIGTWHINFRAQTLVFVAGGTVQSTSGEDLGTWAQDGDNVVFKTGVLPINYLIYNGAVTGNTMTGYVSDGYLPLGQWIANRVSA